jgi:hypothetical protein
VASVNRAFTSETILKKAPEFVFVKASQKLANQFEVKGSPALVVIDPDSQELFRGPVRAEADVSSALDGSLEKYKDQAIAWGTEVAPEAGSKKLLVVGFDKEGFEGLKVLEDRMLVRFHSRCRFVRFPYEKGSDAAKKWGVSTTPTIVISNAGSETPEKDPFSKIQGAKSAPGLRIEFLKAIQKLDSKK